MKIVDLLRQPPVNIFNAQAAGCWMAGLNNAEEVIVCKAVPESKAARSFPGLEPSFTKVEGGVAFDIREGGEITQMVRRRKEILVIFCGGEQRKEVFFELEADEFFGPEVAMGFRAGRMFFIPGLVNRLSEEIDPPSISCRQGQGRSKGGRGDRYG